jgi:hypothetical protein
MSPSCNEPAATDVLASLRRREPQRVLGELRGERARAALGCGPRGLVQDLGGVGVRGLCRQREMPRLHDRVVDDLGDPAMNTAPFVAEVGVENGREQRMCEAKRSVLALDDMCGERGVERVHVDARANELSLLRRAERGRQRERLTRARREPRQT